METNAHEGPVYEPNGLAFLIDESVPYITDTGADQTPGSHFLNRPHHVRTFNVYKGCHLRSRA